ncbi:MAG: error-prone DNA polymerase [Alkalispirochaeta sp.]
MIPESECVPLWCTSVHSFLIGASHPQELVTAAADAGCYGIAITDRDSLGGVVEAWQQVTELGRENPVRESASRESTPRQRSPRLLIGAEVTVAVTKPGEEFDLSGEAVAATVPLSYRVLLYASGAVGYGNISELISHGRLRRPKGESLVTAEEVRALSGEVLMIWTEDSGDETALQELLPAFPGRAWIGISRHFRPGDQDTEMRLRAWAERFDVPIVALPHVLYHHPSRREVQDVLTCIREGTTLDDSAETLLPNASFTLPTPDSMAYVYRDQPQWIAETRRIADRCQFSLSQIQYRYPSETRPDGWTDIGWLRELTRVGAERRYPAGVPAKIVTQLERELELIAELDYSGYFLTMAEIVMFCRREGILCQGRGSAANSIVCYCLGITAVDPVQMDLLFERFISRERAEPPDIDLDIEHRRREEVIQYVYRQYGRERAAMVANLVRFRRRSAVREVGSVFGYSAIMLDQMTKLLSHREMAPGEAAERVGLDPERPRVAAFLRVVAEIIGIPRHLSIHPGGFLLGRDPVARIVPQENATMEGRTVIQWDKHGVEGMNLFKVDLLGLGALTHLDYAFQLLQRHWGVSMTMATIPQDEPEVYAMLRKAETVGVFQLESRAQMAMLPRLRPRTFYDLVVEISIVRPGPITGGMVHPYLRRRRGEELVKYPHPDLEPILAKTLGVPLFQEQVMKLAMAAADYTPGEADQLRRDMAAWRQTGRIEQHQTTIIERMVRRGIDRTFAEQVFEQIRGFGEYGFPESHAASFALIAYATAWVRAFHPTIFTCALLNAWPMGFYTPATIVSDGRRQGVVFRPVDVLFSRWECTLEPLDSGSGGAFAVRMGLRFMQGLGREEGNRILHAQEAEPWLNSGTAGIRRFFRLTHLDADTRVTLAQAGALRSFDSNRRGNVWDALDGSGSAPTAAEHEPNPSHSSSSLIPPEERDARDEHPASADTMLPTHEAVAWDYRASTHSTAAHPLEPYRSWLEDRAYPSAAEVRRMPHGSEVAVVGMVICRQRPSTARGTVFMTLEDETGFVNLVVWNSRFAELRGTLLTASFLGVRGTVQNAEGVVHLIVETVWHARLPHEAVSVESRDFQ